MNNSEQNMIDSNSKPTEKQFGPDCLTRLLGSLLPLLTEPFRDIFHSIDIDLLIYGAIDKNDGPDSDYNYDDDIAYLRQLHQNETLKGDLTISNPLISLNNTSAEFICSAINSALNDLSPNGCAGLIVPLNMLSNGGSMADIIKGLVERKELLAVIQLPDKLFDPSLDMPSCLLLVDRKRDTNQILFIKPDYVKADDISHDERELIRNYCTHAVSNWKESALISSDDIRKQGYQLSPTIYVISLSAQLKQLQEKEPCKSHGEICKVQAGMPPEKNDHKLNIVERIEADIAVKDYTHPCNNYNGLLRRNLGLTPAWAFSSENAAIAGKCLLATFGDCGIAAQIFDPSKSFKKWPHEEEGVLYRYEGINIGKDIVALFPDENIVTMEYLYYQLYSPLVIMQIEAIINEPAKMNSDPFNERRFSDSDWKKIIIPVPDLSAQEAFCKIQKEEIIKNAEMKQQQEYDKLVRKIGATDYKRNVESKLIRHLRHEIVPALANMKYPLLNLKEFLSRNNLLNETIEDDSSCKESSKDIINGILKECEYTKKLLDSIKEFVMEKIDRETFECVDVCNLFENIKQHYVQKSYSINIECSVRNSVYLHRIAFESAIHNLIRNAEMHAFQADSRNPMLNFSIMEHHSRIFIDYTNNGAVFPNLSEEDFFSYQSIKRESPGEGLGGPWIGRVIEAHYGDFKIIRDDFPVHFRITIPREEA